VARGEAEAKDLLSNSRGRWTTLRASGREWRNRSLLAKAWEARHTRMRAEGCQFQTIGLHSKSPRPNECESPWQLWIAPPWKRARFEVGSEMVDVVFRDSTWWSNGNGVSRTNGESGKSGHGTGWSRDLLRTCEYIDLIDITNVSKGLWIGRLTLELAVTIRHDRNGFRGPGVHGLVIGDPDQLQLSVDQERGVILRTQAWIESSLYRTVEMTDVAFDERFSSDTFAIEPLPGQSWADLSD
jgi:hypothetical protein